MQMQLYDSIFIIVQDWVQYFNTISENAGFMLNITNSTVVNVATPGYFQNISDLVFNSRYVLYSWLPDWLSTC